MWQKQGARSMNAAETRCAGHECGRNKVCGHACGRNHGPSAHYLVLPPPPIPFGAFRPDPCIPAPPILVLHARRPTVALAWPAAQLPLPRPPLACVQPPTLIGDAVFFLHWLYFGSLHAQHPLPPCPTAGSTPRPARPSHIGPLGFLFNSPVGPLLSRRLLR